MKKLILFILTLILSGCGAESSDPGAGEEAAEPYTAVLSPDRVERFKLFTEQMLVSGPYEPAAGAYIGAYILSDRIVMGDIQAFEALTGIEHSFYTYFLKMGQPFPTEWILDCIARMKTPNIVLTPRNIEDPFNESLLRESAVRVGEIFVPIFVHLFPVSRSAAYDPEEYTAFFRTAREYFNRYASNAALVWSIDADSLHLMDRHYPGDDYVDWVGINIFVDSDMSLEDVRSRLDFFYFNFNERKPVFISQLAISHFSSRNHAYHISGASHIMEELFKSFINEYPRIRAINYMSFNAIDPVNMRQGIYNFSVTDNELMTRVYRAALSDAHFLGRVDFGAGGDLAARRIRKPGAVLYHEGEFFVRAHIERDSGLLDYDRNALVSVGPHEYRPLTAAAGREFRIHADFNLRTVELRRVR